MTTMHNYDQTLSVMTKNKISVYDLFSQDVPAIWNKPEKTEKESDDSNSKEDEVEEGNQFEGSGMTREELGRHGWAMLHMISATLPIDFGEEFVLRINVFLNLFAQFYPCKVCAGHFLKILSNYPYDGQSREDFMQYMCLLHNKVNKQLGKDIYDCSKVHDQWGGFCGCEEEYSKSVAKYKGHNQV